MKNRLELANYFCEKNYKIGAEIGVADGRYSEILCQRIPGLKLYSIDPWEPYDGNWRGVRYQNRAHRRAQERLCGYDAQLIKGTSLSAQSGIQKESLDFVFIDGAHDFNNSMLDILLWAPKVRKGGIVAGHDYYISRTVHVLPAVDIYCKENNIKFNVIPEYNDGHPDDHSPCWWFEK